MATSAAQLLWSCHSTNTAQNQHDWTLLLSLLTRKQRITEHERNLRTIPLLETPGNNSFKVRGTPTVLDSIPAFQETNIA
jgi:hypothetical protein